MTHHDKSRSLQADQPEDEHLLEDHVYDGIQEADNPLPKWWINLFLVTIVFTVVYVPVAHIFDILPSSQLNRSLAHAARLQEQRELELEASGALDQDPVAAGQKYYKTFCASCHGTYAEGGLCPNLTDAYWIHGPREEDIRAVVTNGVPAKGMPAWGPVLGDRKVKSLTAFVLSLWNSAPPSAGKKPEGTKYEMETLRMPAESDSAAAKTGTSKKV